MFFIKSRIFAISIMLVIILAPFEQAVFEVPVVLAADNSAQTTQAVANVTVVALKNSSTVVFNKSSQTAFLECLPASVMVGGLIQNTAALNLNQPASCFKLSLTQPEVAQSLTVKPLMGNSGNVKLKVIASASILTRFNVASSLPFSQPAVAPLTVVFAIVLVAVIFRSAHVGRKQPTRRLFYGKSITLEQLSMFRC